jgi:hypothetical protein
LLIAELETRVDHLKASETNMKNLFYREQEARKVLEYDYKQLAYECDKHMELRIASDRDLVNYYKSLQKLNEDCEKLRAQLKELEEAALPIARLLVPHPGGAEDSSFGGPAGGSPQPPGDIRQALGEVDPQPDSGLHEVVLPKGFG